ncbi:MAG: hypothetical protein WCK89_07015 [bacterium]
MKAEAKSDPALIDTILDLAKLKNPAVGWNTIGMPVPADRIWLYIAILNITKACRSDRSMSISRA